MSRCRERGGRAAAVAVTAALALVAVERLVHAQACCAATATLTPARLERHEDVLAGVVAKAGVAYGSFDPAGRYAAAPAHTSEQDFEQDAFVAARAPGALRSLQGALLLPVVETRRTTPSRTELGGGVGDVNVALRWDATFAGDDRAVPGVAVLGGFTFPTGRAPESASQPLATDATGVGAAQGTFGLAAEQVWGPWLASMTVLASKRLPRSVSGVDETLGTLVQAIFAVAYTFESRAAVAAAFSWAHEGEASIDGRTAPRTSRVLPVLTLAALYPLTMRWRLQASASSNPPLSGLARNLSASATVTLGVVRSFF